MVDLIINYIVNFILYLIKYMPNELAKILINVLSLILAFLLKRYRNIVATNYNLVYGVKPPFLYSFIHTKDIFQILGYQTINILAVANKKYHLNNLINNVENISYLIEAKNKGKGLIILSAHIGNFAMLNLLMIELGYTNCAMIMREVKNKFIEEELINIRMNANIKFFNESKSKKNARVLVNHLEEKGVLIELADQRNLKGTPLEFFRSKKKTPLGLAKLSILTGSPIVPLFALCSENGKSDIIIKEPIYTDGLKMTNKNILELTTLTNQILEEFIRINFHQWFCFHRWWK